MSSYPWQFFRAGGIDQVQLRSGADLLALEHLDQKLWLALACPVTGIEFDERTLALIDSDGDKRVRAGELIAAIKWAGACLTDVEQLASSKDSLALSSIVELGPDEAPLREAARGMLDALGKTDATRVSVSDAMDATAAFDAQPWNGDGVVPAASCDDDTDAAIITDILACLAEPPLDRSGEPGVNAESIEAFAQALDEYLSWLDAGQAQGVRALGDDTEAAIAAFEAIHGKINDYFARARVAAYDPRALEAINREQSEYLAIAAQDLTLDSEELARFPLVRVVGMEPLPLFQGINPAWAARLQTFVEQVVRPLLGGVTALSEAQWAEICAAMAPYRDWQAARAGDMVAELGEERLREIAQSNWRERLEALVERDLAEKPKADAIAQVEKLVRFSRDLMELANNFVAFRSFYSRRAPAVFQVGTLYIDQRSCDLCVDVADEGRHANMGPHSQAYLLYCSLKNAAGETRNIVAAMTNGDLDNLMVGRNGVFYDRKGNDWDATVTKIVENPVSIRQAFWAPYKKFLRMIEAQISKRAQDAEAAADARLTKAAETTEGAVTTTDAPAEKPKKLDIGVLAAIGVGVSGVVAGAGLLLEAFFGLGLWMPLGLLGLLLMISGPSMLIAWLKLRQRNLAPLLDANGWAVNARARVNLPLGRSLTQLAVLPQGASRDLADPFAEKKRPWPAYAAVIILLIGAFTWYLGRLDNYLPPAARSVSVLGEAAPASINQVRAEKIAAAEADAAAQAESGDAAPADGAEPPDI